MEKCPFYGCRWPEQTGRLQDARGDECGLDVDHHSPCQMSLEGNKVNYFCCPVALRRMDWLDAFDRFVTFPRSGGQVTLRQWKLRNRPGK